MTVSEPTLVATPTMPSPESRLSPRARKVLQLMAERLTEREIAERLSLSPRTVEWYVSDIMTKLNASSWHEAVARATAEDLL